MTSNSFGGSDAASSIAPSTTWPLEPSSEMTSPSLTVTPFEVNDLPEIFTDSATDLTAEPTQLAVVVNAAAHNLTLYLDGTAVGSSVTLNEPLSAINDVNNWLGRSQFAPDDYFAGKISEFRIYSAPLTGPELKTSKQMGENTTYLKKP